MANRTSNSSGLAVPLAVLVVIVSIDVVTGPAVAISAAYAIAAVVAGALTTVRNTILVGALAVLLALLSGLWNQDLGELSWGIRLALAVGLAALGAVSGSIRVRREQALQHMTVVAETVQRAVLRSMPTQVGAVGFAARYVSATRAALVGGDLYEVAETPFGVRVVVGDVRGKGLDAVQLAATVLAAFRRSAFTQSSLPAIADELDKVVTAVATEEDFVTAVLCEFHDDHTVTLVNCGHHSPLLVTATGSVEWFYTGEPVPPLGLGPKAQSVSSPWPRGSRVLLYTDGLVETRDRHGAFFPLEQHAEVLRHGNLEQALDALLERLVDFGGGRLTDDLALVLAEHRSG